MKKKFSALLACIMAVSGLGSMYASAAEVDYSLWDKFIKYDLCITDYDSLTDEEKEKVEVPGITELLEGTNYGIVFIEMS